MSTLREARAAKGLSLRAASQQTGISFNYIAELERGEHRKPSVTVALTLARFYECTVEDIFGWTLETP
jgi:transcriptional regulator with XRE-family HTH domain